MKKMFITERSIEEYRKILVREEKGRLTVEKYVRDMKNSMNMLREMYK